MKLLNIFIRKFASTVENKFFSSDVNPVAQEVVTDQVQNDACVPWQKFQTTMTTVKMTPTIWNLTPAMLEMMTQIFSLQDGAEGGGLLLGAGFSLKERGLSSKVCAVVIYPKKEINRLIA